MALPLLGHDPQYYPSAVEGIRSGWVPHEGQVQVGRAIWEFGYRSVFVQCGRKWGKTEFALDLLWTIAYMFPGSPCYYVAPLQVQAREIVWADPRVINFGPREWLKPGSQGINNSDLRLNFNNGSFIKVDGSDNYEKYRGVRYKVAVYEEYKDHRPEFRRAMRPNASVLDGVDAFVGTPPEMENDFTALAEDHVSDPAKFFFHAPTWQNPHISRQWLRDERAGLYRRGEGDVWEREYAAKFVKGGAQKIFPMIYPTMRKPHDALMKIVDKDWKKLDWIWFADPAAATCFGGLFVAHNPFTKDVYCLDELYERNQGEMTVKKIGHRLLAKRDELCLRGEWRQGYDEAATWFGNEMLDNFQEHLEPSQKAQNAKDDGLTLIKDIMLAGKMHFSDRCKYLYWELDNYFKDKNGKIPKKNDHLIDCLRYILAALYYSVPERPEYKEEEDEEFRGARITDDFPDLGSNWGGENDF